MAIERTVVCALVALLAVLFTWLGGGVVGPWLTPWTPWLTLLLAEAALVLPEQRVGESLFDARRRVWRGVVRDPLAWLAVALVGFLVIQWLNGCVFAVWDGAARAWVRVSPAFDWLVPGEWAEKVAQLPAPRGKGEFVWYALGSQPWGWLPWCLRSDEAWGVLNWFPPSLVAVLAVRHALLARSKRWLMGFVCVMGGVLSVAGIAQYAVGGTFLYWGMETKAFFFATFGYPNHAACWFPAVMALSVGMTLWALEHREHTRMPPWVYGLCAALCAVSGVLSGSRAGMLFTLAVLAFTALYVPVRYFGTMPGNVRWVVTGTLLAAAVVALGTAGFRMHAVTANAARAQALRVATTQAEREAAGAMPTYTAMPWVDEVLGEIAQTDWGAFFAHPMLMRSGYQGILAQRQAADHPVCGTGAWSFRWLNASYINQDDPEERTWMGKRMGVGQANVHNDTLQFLAEHGWVGFGLMLGCALALALPFLRTLLASPAYTVSDEQADRCWLNRLNVFCVFAFVATALIAAHSFIDLVFRSAACMLLYGLAFVCAPGFVVGHRTVAGRLEPAPAEAEELAARRALGDEDEDDEDEAGGEAHHA